MITQWADAHISAAHRGADGVLHGHTWRVRAYRDYLGGDVVDWRGSLLAALEQLDHSQLPDKLTRAEALAEWIGVRLDASRVDVWREPEGLGATWRA